MNESLSTADLDWLAFQYAAGELQGAELDAFERLLATDDRACEALAQAVMLGQAVVQCEQAVAAPRAAAATPTITIVRQPAPLQTNAWHHAVVACAAVCCVLCVSLWSRQAGHDEFPDQSSTVAALWVQGAEEDFASDALPNGQETVLDDEVAVPDWLLAAVHEQQRAADGEEILHD
jgi:hypothetical protein